MHTTDLFDFQFVNRTSEQTFFNNFLTNSSENTLWIKGSRGFGKTKFFKYVLSGRNEYSVCYLDIKINTTSIDIIEALIIELQKLCKIDFITSVRNNYKSFYNNIYKNTEKLSINTFPEIRNIISVILDIGYYAVTYANENKNSIELINDYIRLVLNEKKLCICIDNFSRCDLETAKYLIQIFKKFFSMDNFRSCIITTSEDLTFELKDEIYHNLPVQSINIEYLEEYDYFYQIMNPIFDLDNFANEDIEYLYKKCKGNPKKLSTIISLLLEKDGIDFYNHKKAKINKNILFSILQSEHIKFKDEDFSSEQKWIIFSYLCLKERESIELVMKLAIYISKKCFLYQVYTEEIFKAELLKLINNKILKYMSDNTISYCHDLDYIELMDIFNCSKMKGLFSHYAYEFIQQHPTISSYEELLCRNAREAGINSWVKINFRYGKKLFYKHQIYDAKKILTHLENLLDKLNPLQVLFIAITSYETGNYYLSIKQFCMINPEHLRLRNVKYFYYFYLGKSYNNIGMINSAVEMLEKSLNYIDKDSISYIQTMNVLHMYYFEIPEKVDMAKTVFNDIKNNYEENYPIQWANTMRGCHNFLGDEEALKVLDRAEMKLENELEKAFIYTTRGFVLIKLNNLSKAKQQFNNSRKIIKRLKIHESSYASNNLAICHMLNREYFKAKEILLEALLWNRTNYGDLVIQTHLMMCCIYLNLANEADYYYKFLQNYMETHQIKDPIINRKVYMNLAIASNKKEYYLMRDIYFEKAAPFVTKSSSEWRYHMLTHGPLCSTLKRPVSLYQQVLDFDPWFLVYAHD